ncbi:MAG: threonine/serine exporter family protein [Treponema sp.]
MKNQFIPVSHTNGADSDERALLLQTALYAGELLVRNGAEMYRVEETLLKICTSGGAEDITPFVTPTLIFIADGGGKSFIYTKNIKKRSNNISKIALVNDFSRQFVAGKIALADAMAHLREIEAYKGYPYRLVLFATGIACGIFAVLVGGKFGDFIAAFVASYIAVWINDKIFAHSRTVFTGNFIASMFVGVISIVSFQIQLVDNLDSIIVGAALALVPGVAFTAGIRDFISGDLISGIARIGESVLVAIAIAFGVGSILMVYSILGGL